MRHSTGKRPYLADSVTLPDLAVYATFGPNRSRYTPDVTELLPAASAALGVQITEPVTLSGSGRSAVVRGRIPGSSTVVVKSYPMDEEGAEGFAAEAAGLEFTSGTGTGPDLLATDPAERLVVMTDLGDAPSLATLLLSPSAAPASAAFLSWAVACGRLAARTAGRDQEFTGILARQQARMGVQPPEEHWLLRRIREIPGLLGRLSIEAPAGLEYDLAAVATLLGPGEPLVFSPGDICPDNALLADGGIRFIDFEESGYHPVFLDAAYLRMPFSTCWCAFRLPAWLRDAAEARYRAQVVRIWPRLADDGTWQRGVRRAVAAWSLNSMWWLLDRALAGDESLEPDAVAAPRARQLMRHRWQVLAGELEAGGEFPAIAAMARVLLDATAGWEADELPLYPALR